MLRLLIYAVIIVVFFIAYTRFLERTMIFYPSKEMNFKPSDMGLEYEDVFFVSADGQKINGWFIPAKQAYATVLYFHGNAGNISHRVEIGRMFHDKNMDIFMIDYRGFGKSSGRPQEKGVYLDGLAAYEYLVKTRKITPGKIVIFGKSLGVAIAVEVASKVPAGALICESGFTSTRDFARQAYSFLPFWLCVSQRFDSLEKINRVKMPKLIIHSLDDEIVPFSHGKKLFERATEPKEFYEMHGGHNDAFYVYGGECMQRIEEFIRQSLRP
ncbi:MAG: alpha/beta hydrolase [Candidatus Omnitrophota bacterium]